MKLLARTADHIYFERSEVKDRFTVAKRWELRIKNFPSSFMSSLHQFRGGYRNHSVCPSVCSDACPTQTLFCFDIGFPNWHMGHSWSRDWHRHTKLDTWLYHHETTCCVHSWPVYDLDFDLYVVAGVSLVSFTHSFLWHYHTLCSTWVYHHERMCCVYSWSQHSWSLYDLDLWPQYQNYIFTMNLCLGKSSLFDIEMQILAHIKSITTRHVSH